MPVLFGVKGLVINYTDILTYFTLKTFIETDNNTTIILTYEDIASRIGARESFVKSSISTLVLLGLVSQQKDSLGFTYSFTAVPVPKIMVPVSILTTELTFEEKAALLVLKLSCIENPVDILMSIEMFINQVGISGEKMVEMFESLESKKYLRLACGGGKKPNRYFQLCGRIDWETNDNKGLYQSYSEIVLNKNLSDKG